MSQCKMLVKAETFHGHPALTSCLRFDEDSSQDIQLGRLWGHPNWHQSGLLLTVLLIDRQKYSTK